MQRQAIRSFCRSCSFCRSQEFQKVHGWLSQLTHEPPVMHSLALDSRANKCTPTSRLGSVISATVLSFMLLLAIVWMWAVPSAAFAHSVVDTSGNTRGSITCVQVDSSGQPVAGGQIILYKVASVTVDRITGDANFVWCDGLEDVGEIVDPTTLADGAIAAQLCDDSEVGLQEAARIVPNSEGVATAYNLEPGLYLIQQSIAPDGYFAFSSFLIGTPEYDEGSDTYVYDRSAAPKMTPVTLIDTNDNYENGTDEPETPDPKDVAQSTLIENSVDGAPALGLVSGFEALASSGDPVVYTLILLIAECAVLLIVLVTFKGKGR